MLSNILELQFTSWKTLRRFGSLELSFIYVRKATEPKGKMLNVSQLIH